MSNLQASFLIWTGCLILSFLALYFGFGKNVASFFIALAFLLEIFAAFVLRNDSEKLE